MCQAAIVNMKDNIVFFFFEEEIKDNTKNEIVENCYKNATCFFFRRN